MTLRISVKYLVVCLLTMITGMHATAGVYQWKDADGHVHFGDKLPENVQQPKEVTIQPGPTSAQSRQAEQVYQQQEKYGAELTAERKKREAEQEKLKQQQQENKSKEANTELSDKAASKREKTLYVPVYPCNKKGRLNSPCTGQPQNPPANKPHKPVTLPAKPVIKP